MGETDDHHVPGTAIVNRKTNGSTTVVPRQGPTRRVLQVLNADALRSHARRQRVIDSGGITVGCKKQEPWSDDRAKFRRTRQYDYDDSYM